MQPIGMFPVTHFCVRTHRLRTTDINSEYVIRTCGNTQQSQLLVAIQAQNHELSTRLIKVMLV
jgi:hypothetical protein